MDNEQAAGTVQELVHTVVSQVAPDELSRYPGTWRAFIEHQRSSGQLLRARDAPLGSGLDVVSESVTLLLLAVTGEVLADGRAGRGLGAARRRRQAVLAALTGPAPDPAGLDPAQLRGRFYDAARRAGCPPERAGRLADALATACTGSPG